MFVGRNEEKGGEIKMAMPQWLSVLIKESVQKIFFPIHSGDKVCISSYKELPESIQQGLLISIKNPSNFEEIFNYYNQVNPYICVKELSDIIHFTNKKLK